MSGRGRFWMVFAAAMLLVLLAIVAVVPVPFVTQSPGPVFDVLGDYQGKPVLQVSGTRSYPTSGELDMTTVAELGGANGPIWVGSAIVGLVRPESSVVPDGDVRPEEDQQQIAVFDASKSDALGAAAGYLGRPVRVEPTVVAVTPESGASGRLEPGDVIRSVDGQRIRRAEQVGDIVQGQPAGTEFDFEVSRDGSTVRRTVTSRPGPDDSEQPVVGILLDDVYASDFTVAVNLGQIGGPSAGLLFALGIVDKLTPQDLLAGRHVAGTGTIDGAGTVGEIGGIDKKMIAARHAGAELFLAPRGNCDDTVGVTPEGLTVAPVGSLKQAVTVLEDWHQGAALPTCPADSTTTTNG